MGIDIHPLVSESTMWAKAAMENTLNIQAGHTGYLHWKIEVALTAMVKMEEVASP
jgi:hypothetical protein